MATNLPELFRLRTSKCAFDACQSKGEWQPIFLIFAPCDDPQCTLPHFNAPGVMIQDAAYCGTHYADLKLADLLPDKFWGTITADFSARGLKMPRKDWTAVSFHKVPDNVVPLGPRLVPKNLEPLPPSA